MLPQWLNAKIHLLISVIVARTLGRTSLSATTLTIASPILIAGSVWLLASGSFFWAGCLIIFASTFDVLDGALARAKDEVSRFGAFLDSTLDRYSEAFIFMGLLLYYQRTSPGTIDIFLIYIAIVGSFLISYIRARAEALGFDCKVGLLERPERIILVVVGLMLGWVHGILWVLAILTHVTAIQRFVHVWRQSRKEKSQSGLLPVTQRSKWRGSWFRMR